MNVRLEDLGPGQRIAGLRVGESVEMIHVGRLGDDVVEVAYRRDNGELGQRMLYRADEARLSVAAAGGRPFDGSPEEFRLAAEADRIRLAGVFDPMVAISTSDVQPLPHQIRAVYEELLQKTPLRFLLADDPGAGKTIMAGLYVKELKLRGAAERVLIVAPGGLVEQWQDELWFKFGLRFRLLTSDMINATLSENVFDEHPFLIARMDQLSRNDDLIAQLRGSQWDVVVVDEAHRMSARHFGGKLNKTKRFQLGEVLGDVARHLLLMTATPHAGKEEDFQQFLTLLDRDRYEGKFRAGVHSTDTAGLMRRMVKEELLTFEGRPLFPERVAETVPYQLSEPEYELYDAVTDYVRDEMNRAERLTDSRRNTVGFALTVLQRRLASSPEAIYQSLVRRLARLERRREEIVSGRVSDTADTRRDSWDEEEMTADELEQLEAELVDAATASQTLPEVEHEIGVVRGLVRQAAQVRAQPTDRKWAELRSILQDRALLTSTVAGTPRKLIVFTEHRDTLDYLQRRIRELFGRHEVVVAIHGGVNRVERRRVTEEFTHNPECQVMVATDAAGEGLNLQAAHLMVNYDLPWNPNRLEQRFGRIHRIGQREVCRLWNLVAEDTREGEVYRQLLTKIEAQGAAYGGKVFDVLGEAFSGRALRDLLLEAIRYGDQPAVRARLFETVDETVSQGLPELLRERALASETMPVSEVEKIRIQMEEARARRLQPHFVERFFQDAFVRMGGRIAKREAGRFEIRHVPQSLRAHDRLRSVATRYSRITFCLTRVHPEGLDRAELLAPGHPLMDAVCAAAVERWGAVLLQGATFVDDVDAPTLLVGALQTAVNGDDRVVSRRFSWAASTQDQVSEAGPAPYLQADGADESPLAQEQRAAPWLAGAESGARQWMVQHALPSFLGEIDTVERQRVEHVRTQVTERLNQEIARLHLESMEASQRVAAGKTVRRSAEFLTHQTEELETRLQQRLVALARAAEIHVLPPDVRAVALVLPRWLVVGTTPEQHARDQAAIREVERRAVDLVMATERALGRIPTEMRRTNKGFDVRSATGQGEFITIEVKGRIAGADDVVVTAPEVLKGRNTAPRYRFAMVRVDPLGPEHDQVRYRLDPFAGVSLGDDLKVTKVLLDWDAEWAKGVDPC